MILLLLACTQAPPPPPPPQAPVVEAVAQDPDPVEIAAPPAPEIPFQAQRSAVPEGFTPLGSIPGIEFSIGYHRADNFTGAPLPGYGVPDAWLLDAPAEALKQVQLDLAPRGLGLLIYDAYRPVRATLGMVAWAERSGNTRLLDEGYVARRSGHNHGHTVDLTLIALETGAPLDMGTPWDSFSEDAHTANAAGAVAEHRKLLVDAMAARGFRNYSKEWWHFSYKMEGTTPRDVPYACFEPAEAAWTAPEGWSTAGWTPPAAWTPTPCE
ncbi:MAG: peptidase M15 [Alphaproteobacteria bacterium]|nr:peptidase M15 [Alphaproteobacteria bacterium]